MFRRVSLSVFVFAATAMAASAADLPARSQLGVIFAEPAEVPPPIVYHSVEIPAPIITYTNLPDPLWNRGTYNYGSSWSWYNPGPYYGGPYYGDGARLPYVCGLYGYCF
jgi:hypothetical protein